MTVQRNFTYHTIPTIPEVLLIILMINTAIFAITSILAGRKEMQLIYDAIAAYSTFYISDYLLLNLLPVFPARALLVIISLLIVFMIPTILWCWKFGLFVKSERQKVVTRSKFIPYLIIILNPSLIFASFSIIPGLQLFGYFFILVSIIVIVVIACLFRSKGRAEKLAYVC
jgi:hypothetical protein